MKEIFYIIFVLPFEIMKIIWIIMTMFFYVIKCIIKCVFDIISIILILFGVKNSNQKNYVFSSDVREELNKIDNMDGLEFEKYVCNLLRKNGFKKVQVTKSSGDYGADVIAEKENIRYAFQCKRFSDRVGAKSIGEVMRGMKKYNCSKGVVFTNNTYTKQAIEEAKICDIELWDRENLIILLDNVCNSQKNHLENKESVSEKIQKESVNKSLDYDEKELLEQSKEETGTNQNKNEEFYQKEKLKVKAKLDAEEENKKKRKQEQKVIVDKWVNKIIKFFKWILSIILFFVGIIFICIVKDAIGYLFLGAIFIIQGAMICPKITEYTLNHSNFIKYTKYKSFIFIITIILWFVLATIFTPPSTNNNSNNTMIENKTITTENR